MIESSVDPVVVEFMSLLAGCGRAQTRDQGRTWLNFG
jgi:hypothetical protein